MGPIHTDRRTRKGNPDDKDIGDARKFLKNLMSYEIVKHIT